MSEPSASKLSHQLAPGRPAGSGSGPERARAEVLGSDKADAKRANGVGESPRPWSRTSRFGAGCASLATHTLPEKPIAVREAGEGGVRDTDDVQVQREAADSTSCSRWTSASTILFVAVFTEFYNSRCTASGGRQLASAHTHTTQLAHTHVS